MAVVGSCVALGRLQRGSGSVATGLFAWQWGILTWKLAVGGVAVGAWQRGTRNVAAWQWGRGSGGVAAWQSGAWQRGSRGAAVGAWQYCHVAPGSVAVLPRPGCHAARGGGVAVLPRPDCHATTPARLPRCHAPTATLPRPNCDPTHSQLPR